MDYLRFKHQPQTRVLAQRHVSKSIPPQRNRLQRILTFPVKQMARLARHVFKSDQHDLRAPSKTSLFNVVERSQLLDSSNEPTSKLPMQPAGSLQNGVVVAAEHNSERGNPFESDKYPNTTPSVFDEHSHDSKYESTFDEQLQNPPPARHVFDLAKQRRRSSQACKQSNAQIVGTTNQREAQISTDFSSQQDAQPQTDNPSQDSAPTQRATKAPHAQTQTNQGVQSNTQLKNNQVAKRLDQASLMVLAQRQVTSPDHPKFDSQNSFNDIDTPKLEWNKLAINSSPNGIALVFGQHIWPEEGYRYVPEEQHQAEKVRLSTKLRTSTEHLRNSSQAMIYRGRSFVHVYKNKPMLFDETGTSMLRFFTALGANQNAGSSINGQHFTAFSNLCKDKLWLAACDPQACVGFENLAFGRQALLIPIQQLFAGALLHNMNVEGPYHPIKQLLHVNLPIEFAEIVIPALLRYGVSDDSTLAAGESFASMVQKHYQLKSDHPLVLTLDSNSHPLRDDIRKWQNINQQLVELAPKFKTKTTKPNFLNRRLHQVRNGLAKTAQHAEDIIGKALDALESEKTHNFVFVPAYVPLRNLFDATAQLPRLQLSQADIELAAKDQDQFLDRCVPNKTAFKLQQQLLALFGQESDLTNMLYYFEGLPRDTLAPLVPPLSLNINNSKKMHVAVMTKLKETAFINQTLMTQTHGLSRNDIIKIRCQLREEITENSKISRKQRARHHAVVVGLTAYNLNGEYPFSWQSARSKVGVALLKQAGVSINELDCNYLPLEPNDLQWFMAEPYRLAGYFPPEQHHYIPEHCIDTRPSPFKVKK